jgi:hypothetical protein
VASVCMLSSSALDMRASTLSRLELLPFDRYSWHAWQQRCGPFRPSEVISTVFGLQHTTHMCQAIDDKDR